MKRARHLIALPVAACLAALCSCSSSNSAGTTGQDDPLAKVNAAALAPKGIVGRGPDGAEGRPAGSIVLTPGDIAKARTAKFRVGIVMQTMNVEWSTEQVRGITDELRKYNAQVVGVVDPDYSVEKQVAGIQNMIQKAPDAILSIPVDDTATAATYKQVARAGIKLILMDNVPKGMQYPTDYQAMVSSDNQGDGAVGAKALAAYIPRGGAVGVLHFGVDFRVTEDRRAGFVDWMKANRPDIKIKEVEFLDPAKAGDEAANFLTANPDVQGMFTEWEVPATGIESALRAQGRSLPITSVNIASDVALDMANDGMIKAVGAQVPYDQGKAEAKAAIASLLGKQVPQWIAFPAVPVTQNNVLDAWRQVYHGNPPAQLTETCRKNHACDSNR
ncbi:substrate-binding domain-containing protein [Streptomyces sp. NPDC001984]